MSIWLKSNEAGLRSSWWENLRGHLERDKLRILNGIQVVAEFCLSHSSTRAGLSSGRHLLGDRGTTGLSSSPADDLGQRANSRPLVLARSAPAAVISSQRSKTSLDTIYKKLFNTILFPRRSASSYSVALS